MIFLIGRTDLLLMLFKHPALQIDLQSGLRQHGTVNVEQLFVPVEHICQRIGQHSGSDPQTGKK